MKKPLKYKWNHDIFSHIEKNIEKYKKRGARCFLFTKFLNHLYYNYLFSFFLLYDEEIFEYTRTLCTDYDE